MRVGLYEVLLIGDNNQAFEETWIGEQCYFHAIPDRHYHVKINIYRDPNTMEFPSPYLRFGLYIDGNDVQYWKRLDLSDASLLPKDDQEPRLIPFLWFQEKQ